MKTTFYLVPAGMTEVNADPKCHKTESLEDPALAAFNWQHSTPLDAIGGSVATSEAASFRHWMLAGYSFLL